MVDLASRVMTGESLRDLGYGTGLYKTPPYFAIKVPVFSFQKLSDVNSILGPEMKSTGEVLGIGRTMAEALFKGLTSAGYNLRLPSGTKKLGALISVDKHDYFEVVTLAKKFYDLGIELYATPGTAEAISHLGIDVEVVPAMKDGNDMMKLLDTGKIDYVIYTGCEGDTVDNYKILNQRAIQLSIACLTSLDTANALADIFASHFNQQNTELVDINNMRTKRRKVKFAKMESASNDYIYIENFDGKITNPESLCVSLCNRHTGIGGDGIVLMEKSTVADVKMRIFNIDGSEGMMAGNAIRCVGKYVYDNGMCAKRRITVETASGIKNLKLYTMNGKVSSVSVRMGMANLDPASLPTTLEGDKILDREINIGGKNYNVTCVSVGNPHCVVLCKRVDGIDIQTVGPLFENSEYFPNRVNTEFVRIVNEGTIKMRVWERGNGETMACGTGACAAVVAAVENGFCKRDTEITVQVPGGELIVKYKEDGNITLSGNARLVFEGEIEI